MCRFAKRAIFDAKEFRGDVLKRIKRIMKQDFLRKQREGVLEATEKFDPKKIEDSVPIANNLITLKQSVQKFEEIVGKCVNRLRETARTSEEQQRGVWLEAQLVGFYNDSDFIVIS